MASEHEHEQQQPPPPQHSKTCPICLEDFDEPSSENAVAVDLEEDRHPLQQPQQQDLHRPLPLTCCHHTFCLACLLAHVEYSVESKRTQLSCPEIGCRAVLPDDALGTILEACRDSTVVARVERWQQQAAQPNSVPCTQCPALVPANEEEDTNNSPDLSCPACHHAFCRVHGDMHGTLTCVQFQQTPQGIALRQSELAIQQFTKPCSRCGALLQKATGCDYVLCGHCRGDMCYRCGTHVHLQGDTFRRCTECRSTYHHEVRLPCLAGTLCLMMMVLFTIALIVVWPAVAGVGILLSGCCGGFFECGRRLDGGHRRRPRRHRHDEDDTNHNRGFQPGRGILAVVVILFLPLVMLLDGAYMVLSGNEDGFLDGLLPELSGKAEEIPAMELQPTTATTTITTMITTTGSEDVDLEQGHGGEGLAESSP